MSEALNNDATTETDTTESASITADAWDLLDSLTGTLEGPEDWAEQLDHYFYGTPKQ